SRRRVEAEHEIEKRMGAIIEATTDLIAIFDAETKRLVYLNRAGKRLAGYEGDHFRNDLTVGDLHPTPTLEVLEKEAFPAAMAEGAWHGETRLVARDGKERVLSQVVLAHKRSNGDL